MFLPSSHHGTLAVYCDLCATKDKIIKTSKKKEVQTQFFSKNFSPQYDITPIRNKWCYFTIILTDECQIHETNGLRYKNPFPDLLCVYKNFKLLQYSQKYIFSLQYSGTKLVRKHLYTSVFLRVLLHAVYAEYLCKINRCFFFTVYFHLFTEPKSIKV